ncbi:unnamed protein product [Symbiodinium sp. CCMP2456]|nr:unnamed protein product [Symbiodinium sp. CCMP2456]
MIQEAHSLLYQWTSVLWGEPIQEGGNPSPIPASEATTIQLPNTTAPSTASMGSTPKARAATTGSMPDPPPSKDARGFRPERRCGGQRLQRRGLNVEAESAQM